MMSDKEKEEFIRAYFESKDIPQENMTKEMMEHTMLVAECGGEIRDVAFDFMDKREDKGMTEEKLSLCLANLISAASLRIDNYYCEHFGLKKL